MMLTEEEKAKAKNRLGELMNDLTDIMERLNKLEKTFSRIKNEAEDLVRKLLGLS